MSDTGKLNKLCLDELAEKLEWKDGLAVARFLDHFEETKRLLLIKALALLIYFDQVPPRAHFSLAVTVLGVLGDPMGRKLFEEDVEIYKDGVTALIDKTKNMYLPSTGPGKLPQTISDLLIDAFTKKNICYVL